MHNRKVAIVGRSMLESSEIAQDLGYLDLPPGLSSIPARSTTTRPSRVMVLISGTQGEPMCALSRAAVDNHKHAKIRRRRHRRPQLPRHPRQREVHLPRHRPPLRRDADVIYDDGTHGLIHVSGHGSARKNCGS